MAIAIVTNGYLFSVMLIAALALARPTQALCFRRNWETKLATALALGIFPFAMYAYFKVVG